MFPEIAPCLTAIKAVKRAVEIDRGSAVLPEGIVRTELANTQPQDVRVLGGQGLMLEAQNLAQALGGLGFFPY